MEFHENRQNYAMNLHGFASEFLTSEYQVFLTEYLLFEIQNSGAKTMQIHSIILFNFHGIP